MVIISLYTYFSMARYKKKSFDKRQLQNKLNFSEIKKKISLLFLFTWISILICNAFGYYFFFILCKWVGFRCERERERKIWLAPIHVSFVCVAEWSEDGSAPPVMLPPATWCWCCCWLLVPGGKNNFIKIYHRCGW